MIRALIWGKTYPELSSRHVETVCTGAVREDGTPVRLYPVPLRYLHGSKQYSLYDWIEVPVEKSTRDPRPESYRVRSDSIRVVGHLGTGDGWYDRRAQVFRDSTWLFDSVDALKEARTTSGRSMGIVSVGHVEQVAVQMLPEADEAEFHQKWLEVQSQQDMFHPQYKELEYLPYRINLAWRCAGDCAGCATHPHEMGVLDWGLLELARKSRDPEKAASKLRQISDLTRYDFKLFMGNFKNRPWQFGVIGLWYPKRFSQIDLLSPEQPV